MISYKNNCLLEKNVQIFSEKQNFVKKNAFSENSEKDEKSNQIASM